MKNSIALFPIRTREELNIIVELIIKRIAVKEYERKMEFANEHFPIANFCYDKGMYVNGSFDLHQVCERCYNVISLVFNNYKPKTYDLKVLGERVKNWSRELDTIFPQTTDFEKHCYNLLYRTYIEARYNPGFTITKQEYEYLSSKTEILK